MKSKLFALSLAAALFFGAGAPVSGQDALQNLVPDDAMGVFYVKSLGQLQNEVKALAEKFQEGAGDEIDLQMMLGFIGIEDELDLSKPAAFAIGGPTEEGGEPTPVFILPFVDAKEAAASINSSGEYDSDAVVRGNFVAFCPEGTYKPGGKPCKLLNGIPNTDLALRLDLGTLIAKYKNEIAAVMDEATEEMMREVEREGAAATAAVKPMLEFVKGFIDSARLLDVTFDINGTNVDLRTALTVGQGTPLAKGSVMGSATLPALAGFLPSSHPVSMMMSFDMEGMMKAFMPMYDAMGDEMPEEFADAFKSLMKANLELVSMMGDDMAFSLGAGSKGIEFVEVFTSDDPEALVKKWSELMQTETLQKMGFVAKVGDAQRTAAGSYREVEFSVDWDKFSKTFGAPAGISEEVEPMLEALFGSKNLKFGMATAGKAAIVSFGGDNLMEKCIAGAAQGAKGTLAKTLEKAGKSPAMVFSMDLRGIMKAAGMVADRMGMGDEIPDLGKGPPCPVGVYAGRTGLVFRGGIHADLGQIAEMFAPFMR